MEVRRTMSLARWSNESGECSNNYAAAVQTAEAQFSTSSSSSWGNRLNPVKVVSILRGAGLIFL